jgi:hypothetical protein
MKKGYFLGLLALAIGFFSLTSATKGAILYKLDTKTSKINWDIMDQSDQSQKGTMKFKSGNIKFDSKRITSGFFYINLQSLKCTSISDAGFNADLAEWVRGESNLNAIKQKEVTIKILKATRKGMTDGVDDYMIAAQVNVKGIKKTVEFPAKVKYAKKATFKAKLMLPAADFSMEKDLNLAIDVVVIKS